MPNYIQRPNPYLEAANFGSSAGNSMAEAMLKLPLQRMALARQAQQDQLEQQRAAQMQQYRQDQLAREQQRDKATDKYRQDEVTQRQAHDKMEQRRYDADRLTRATADRNKAKQGDIKAAQAREDAKRRQAETDSRIDKNKAEIQKLQNPPSPFGGLAPSVATELMDPQRSALTGEARTNLANAYYVNAMQKGTVPPIGFLQPNQTGNVSAPAPVSAPPSPALAPPPVTGGATNTFPTPDHVKAAVKSGQLTPEQASDILQKQFGFTP